MVAYIHHHHHRRHPRRYDSPLGRTRSHAVAPSLFPNIRPLPLVRSAPEQGLTASTHSLSPRKPTVADNPYSQDTRSLIASVADAIRFGSNHEKVPPLTDTDRQRETGNEATIDNAKGGKEEEEEE